MKQKQLVPMIATSGMYYGRHLKAGDHFEADPDHLPLLTEVAKIREPKEEDEFLPGRAKYKRRDMRPEK